MSVMEAWKEQATLLRRAEPKRDPLGVTFRAHDVQEIALAPVLAHPAAVRRMAARTVADYSIAPEAVAEVRR